MILIVEIQIYLVEKKKLVSLLKILNVSNISFSPLKNFNSWNDLKNLRSKSLNNHIEGIMLKKKIAFMLEVDQKVVGISGKEILFL